MSLSTSAALLGTTLEAVEGVENVQVRPGVPTDQDLAEATLEADGQLQRWIVYYAPRVTHAEFPGGHPELDVQVLAVWSYREDEDTFAAFTDRLSAAQLALMTAFPQIDEQAIQPLEQPGEPIRSPEGYSVYRARFGFHLLDVTHT